MVLQNYQNFTEMTSNMIYIVAFVVGLKCPRKTHLNTQCPLRPLPAPSVPSALLSCSRCFKASKIQSAPYCTILETAKLKCCEGAKFQRHLIVESQLLLRISEITPCTLCCKCLRRFHFGLETRVIIKIESHQWYVLYEFVV